MWSTGTATVVNVLVAYPLIFGIGLLPELGIAGVAWGLVAGRLVSCGLSLGALARRRTGPLAGTLGGVALWRPDVPAMRRMLAVGGPAALEAGSVQVGFLIFSLMVIHLGTAAYAAQQVVFSIGSVSMLPGFAFSVASTTLVGQRSGAGDFAGAAQMGWRCTRIATTWSLPATGALLLLAEPILRFYTSDPEVVAAGLPGLRVIALGQPLQATAFVMAGALRGAGDTRTTMIVGSIAMWGLRLTLAYALAILAGWGVLGVWIGWLGDWTTRGLAYLYAFHRGRWKRVRF
jgi:putative MATE family efflux protein